MIRSIKFASVPVSDQDRSLEFYTSKLGFAIQTDQPMGEDMRWIDRRQPTRPSRPQLGSGHPAEGSPTRARTR